MNSYKKAPQTTADWTWSRVRYELSRKEKLLSDVARSAKVGRSAISNVARIPTPRLQSAIAAVIGKKPQKIWPSRYTREGEPIRPLIWLKSNKIKELRNVKNGRAA